MILLNMNLAALKILKKKTNPLVVFAIVLSKRILFLKINDFWRANNNFEMLFLCETSLTPPKILDGIQNFIKTPLRLPQIAKGVAIYLALACQHPQKHYLKKARVYIKVRA